MLIETAETLQQERLHLFLQLRRRLSSWCIWEDERIFLPILSVGGENGAEGIIHAHDTRNSAIAMAADLACPSGRLQQVDLPANASRLDTK